MHLFTTQGPLTRRFGEFYKRFYSAVSGVGGGGGGGGGGGARGVGSGGGAGAGTGEMRASARRGRRRDVSGRMAERAEREQKEKEKEKEKKRLPRPVLKERRLQLEYHTTHLTTRFLEHDRLTRDLRRELSRRHPSPTAAETALLQRTLRFVSTHFYPPPPPHPAPPPPLTPYLPPFPNYTSPTPPTPLNRSLVRLLLLRPPPPTLIPKICYNLLTSPEPPNTTTYNILIEGLTHTRHGALAHIVFRTLLSGAGRPTEGTIIRMLNLTTKTSDRASFDRIARATAARHMSPSWKPRAQRRRSKMLFNALISGAARFGDVQQVRVWVRAMRRECPGDPRPGVYLLTSLMRLWREKGEWDRGLRAWRDLMRLDRDWRRVRGGERADLRAFVEMLRLCRRCGKKGAFRKVLAAGVRRGWRVEELVWWVSKTKGLWVRRGNKTPHIKGMRTRWAGRGEEVRGVLDALRAWWGGEKLGVAAAGVAAAVPVPVVEEKQRPQVEQTEDPEPIVIGDSPGRPPQPRIRRRRRIALVSDAAKLELWDTIISRRMYDVPPAFIDGVEVRADFGLMQTVRGDYDGSDGGVRIMRVYF